MNYSYFKVVNNQKVYIAERIADSMAIELLVADDEPMIRRLFSVLLNKSEETSGIPFAIAGSGEEALSIAEQNLGSLKTVITDTDMPGMNGYKLIEKLRGIGYKNAIIQMTGSILNEKSPLADYLLNKPFQLDELKGLFAKYKTQGRL